MSSRDMTAFIGHVVMAMRFVADFIDGMTLDDFLADRRMQTSPHRDTALTSDPSSAPSIAHPVPQSPHLQTAPPDVRSTSPLSHAAILYC